MPSPTRGVATSVLPPQAQPPVVGLSDLAPHQVADAEVVALPVLAGDDGPVVGPGAADLAAHLGLDLLGLLESEQATGAAREVVRVPVAEDAAAGGSVRLVLLVGVGSGSPTDLRRAGAALARAVAGRDRVVTTLAAVGTAYGNGQDGSGQEAAVEAVVTGLVLASFVFRWSDTPPAQPPVTNVVLALAGGTSSAVLDRAVAIAAASWKARGWATVPSNLKNPAWLADQAVELAAGSGLECTVWDEHELARQGCGGILGVGQGSATPPRLVRLDYTPPRAGRKTPTVVLVGKGITFDTGGLSIKPAESMSTMKRDMTGGAVVMGVMSALAAVGCPVRVVGLVAAAENAVGGSSIRPGDVLRHYGGRTSEVTNTDAEGRLVMADALAYAADALAPAAMVDVATLTGAVKVALGLRTGGCFANDEALAGALLGASATSGEPLWRMPLAAEYEERLSSPVADADNAPGGPGAITAALFLQHFTGGVPWAHLDIASVGDSADHRDEYTPGPTGFGVRLLLTWLGGDAPLAGVGA